MGDSLVRRDRRFNRLSACCTGFILGVLTGGAAQAAADISIANAAIAEGNSGTATLNFTVTRSGDLDSAIVLEYETTTGSATAGVDYTPVATTEVTVPANATTVQLPVSVAGDTDIESDETFTLQLTSARRAAPTLDLAAAQGFSTGGTPRSIAVADINRDGLADAVIATGNGVAVLLNTTAAGAATATFAASQAFTAGSNTSAVAVGDLNGDGARDVAVANQNDGTVSVLLNTTAPAATTVTLATASSFASGTNSVALAIADFNGDGRRDLAVVNRGSNNVAVLLNTTTEGATTPSFAAATVLAVGATPGAIAVADFSADGRPDLAVSNEGTNNVAVLVNATVPGATTPAFDAAVNFSAGFGPTGVDGADVNGDGRPDLAVANNATNTAAVLLNTMATGTLGFTTAQSFATAAGPRSVALADVDNDGRRDLVVTATTAGAVSVLINGTTAGAGTPTFAAAHSTAAGTSPYAVALADFNGDGRADISVANQAAAASVLLNETAAATSTPKFAAAQSLAANAAPLAVAIADFDTDGRLDIGATPFSGTNISAVIINSTPPGSSSGVFGAQVVSAALGPRSIALADLNGDGKPDHAVAYFNNNYVAARINTQAPGTGTQFFTADLGPISVALGDINGDGRPDLVAANQNSGNVSVLVNTTAPNDGNPSVAAPQNFIVGSVPYFVVLSDFNLDGRLDAAVAHATLNAVSVLLNTTTPGSSTVTFASATNYNTGSSPLSLTAGDLNGDGKPELVVPTYNHVSILRNTMAPGAAAASFATAQAFGGEDSRTAVLADVSGDGKLDIAVAHYEANNVSLLLNETPAGATTFVFAAGPTYAVAGGPQAIAAGDLNGDGRPELAVACELGRTVDVLWNRIDAVTLTDNEGLGTIADDDADTVPDTFQFSDQAAVPVGTVRESDAVTIVGINTTAPISVSGGEFSKNGAAYTATTGTVANGDQVRVRHTASVMYSTTTSTTLTVGGVSDTFTSTTEAHDSVPDAFAFTDQSDADLGSVRESNIIAVAGINAPAAISISGGEYSRNGGPYASSVGTVENGDTVRVRHTASGTPATTVDTTLTIGGISDTFSSTTVPPDTTPDAFSFVDQADVAPNATITSAIIIVTGINAAASIGVTGGSYSIDGGAFTSDPGTVANGQSVQLRHTASAAFSTPVDTVLTVGGVADTFTSTTIAQDTTPVPFTFTDITGAARATVIESASVTVSGITGGVAVSVDAGEYRKNGGAWTSAAGTLTSGDSLQLRLTSSSLYATATSMTVTLGTYAETFTVTTQAAPADGNSGGGGGGTMTFTTLYWILLLSAFRRVRARATVA